MTFIYQARTRGPQIWWGGDTLTTMTKSRRRYYRSNLKAGKRFGLKLNTLLQLWTDFNVLYSTRWPLSIKQELGAPKYDELTTKRKVGGDVTEEAQRAKVKLLNHSFNEVRKCKDTSNKATIQTISPWILTPYKAIK